MLHSTTIPPKQNGIKQGHQRQRDLSQLQHAGWQMGEQLDSSNGVACKRLCQVSHPLPNRLRQHPQNDRRATDEHDRRLGRQDERVGDQSHQREAAKIISHDRQGRRLGRQGEQEILPHRARQALNGCRREAPGGKVDERLGQRIGVEHQAQRGHEGELKADVPQEVWVGEGHQRGDQAQAVEPILLAADLAGEQRQGAHQGGAHDSGFGANQNGIQPDGSYAEPGGQEAAALPQQFHEQGGEQTGQNRNIEPTDVKPKSMLFSK
jgi:hypothetical protein